MNEIPEADGMKLLEEAAHRYARYPQGFPRDVKITLTDEQWNAVAFALEGMLIANHTENSCIAPEFIDTQWQEAMTVIRKTMQDTLRPLAEAEVAKATEQLIREIEEEQQK